MSTIAMVQVGAFSCLLMVAMSCLFWADIRRFSGLTLLIMLTLAAAFFHFGYMDHLSGIYDLIMAEFSRGFGYDFLSLKGHLLRSEVLGSLAFQLSSATALFFLCRQPFYLMFLTSFRRERDVNHVLLVLALIWAGLTAPLLGLIVGVWSRRKYENHELVVDGDQVIDNVNESYFVARLCLLRELWRSGSLREAQQYVFIHPAIRVIEESLRTGFLILAGIGSGKTNALYNWLMVPFLAQRKYRLLIYDQKGDFTSVLGGRDDVAIISPFLENSFAWHIGRDINTSSKMVEYLDQLGSFEDTQKSSFFVGAFVDFGTAVFLFLRDEKGENWTFRDLFSTMQTVDRLFDIVKHYRPEAEMFARRDEEIDQARGVIGTIREKLLKIEPLARAWQSGQEKIAIRDFFAPERVLDRRVLIVRGDKEFEVLNRAFSTTFLETSIKVITNGPEQDSMIAVFIDELQTLGKLPSLPELFRVGRSKGIRGFIGTQDWARTDKQYADLGGKKGIEGSVLNKMVGVMAGGDEAEAAAKSFKYVNREVWRRDSKTKKWVVQRENNVQALVSGQLSLPKPTLTRPAYFYFKHSDWPILKIAYKIVPLPEASFKARPALWLSDADMGGAVSYRSPEPRELEALDGVSKEASKGGSDETLVDGSFDRRMYQPNQDTPTESEAVSSPVSGEKSGGEKSGDRSRGGQPGNLKPSEDVRPEDEGRAVKKKKTKGRKSGIKIKKFRR